MKKYVVGFVFDSQREHILLIHKNRPEWQKGFINGLGGKIEEGESAVSAVAREITEESGLVIAESLWVYLGRIYSDEACIEFFGIEYQGVKTDAYTREDEPIEWFQLADLPPNLIENLKWLIPLSVQKLKSNRIDSFEVKYTHLSEDRRGIDKIK